MDSRFRPVDTDAAGNKDMSQGFALLIERSAELKQDLIQFTQGPRLERSLTAALLEAAGPEGDLGETEVIRVIDRFALQHRRPDGKTATRPRFVPGKCQCALLNSNTRSHDLSA